MASHAEGSAGLGWSVAAQTGAALAAAMGVGRFVFTPILPMMELHAHLARADASALATANYLGYLIGALVGIAVPRISRRRSALRISGVVLVLTLVAMPLTDDVTVWALIRGVAGVASAIVLWLPATRSSASSRALGPTMWAGRTAESGRESRPRGF